MTNDLEPLRECLKEARKHGKALLQCESETQAKEWLQIIAPHLPADTAICIIRQRELNVYTWHYPLSKEEQAKQDEHVDKRALARIDEMWNAAHPEIAKYNERRHRGIEWAAKKSNQAQGMKDGPNTASWSKSTKSEIKGNYEQDKNQGKATYQERSEITESSAQIA